jgi:hypothetical protein
MLGYAGLSAEALERAGELLGDCIGKLEDEARREACGRPRSARNQKSC